MTRLNQFIVESHEQIFVNLISAVKILYANRLYGGWQEPTKFGFNSAQVTLNLVTIYYTLKNEI